MPFKSTLVNCKQCVPPNRTYFRRIVTNKKEYYSEICKECEKENKVNQEWKYEDGAKIHKPGGHRSILDNGWIPTTRLKKGTYGFIKTKKR